MGAFFGVFNCENVVSSAQMVPRNKKRLRFGRQRDIVLLEYLTKSTYTLLRVKMRNARLEVKQ